MRQAARTLNLLYGCLLRLYPPQFRAEFAEEMREVFAQRLRETHSSWTLAAVILSELRDLPFTLIREHLREAHQKASIGLQEGILMRRTYFSPRLFRWCIITLFAIFVLYVCSATAAYFVFDLSHNDLNRAGEWWYAVADQPGYIGNLIPLTLVGMFLWVCSPMLIVLAGGLLFIMLWRRWPGLSRRLRRIAITALLAGCFVFLTMGSPIGYMAALWLYD
ncbi:MAG: hypothetical protein K8I30_14765 [Anaerolineae bacterium]|nr:hypothetical protein [Anaerolineae bacterium]